MSRASINLRQEFFVEQQHQSEKTCYRNKQNSRVCLELLNDNIGKQKTNKISELNATIPNREHDSFLKIQGQDLGIFQITQIQVGQPTQLSTPTNGQIIAYGKPAVILNTKNNPSTVIISDSPNRPYCRYFFGPYRTALGPKVFRHTAKVRNTNMSSAPRKTGENPKGCELREYLREDQEVLTACIKAQLAKVSKNILHLIIMKFLYI